MRTIVIVCRETNDFDVIVHAEATAVADRLAFDEMIGTVINLAHPVVREQPARFPPYQVKTIEEFRERERELRRRIATLEVQALSNVADVQA